MNTHAKTYVSVDQRNETFTLEISRSKPIKDAGCFLQQETLHPSLSTDWLQERILVLFHK